MLAAWKENYDKSRQHIKKQKHHFANKGLYNQSYGFPVVINRCFIWTIKKAEGQRIEAFELLWVPKTLESPLDSKEIKSVNPKGNQPWIFIGRTVAEVEDPMLWLSDAKSQHNGKEPDAGKYRRQWEKGTIEDEMVGWHHWLNRHEFKQTLEESEGQGSLVCGSPWGQREPDMT